MLHGICKKYIYMIFSCILMVVSVCGFFVSESVYSGENVKIQKKAMLNEAIIMNSIYKNITTNNKLVTMNK